MTIEMSRVDWERNRQAGLDLQQLRPANIAPLLAHWRVHPEVGTAVLGQSFEGREILSLTLGQGPIRVLAWSQMHGDESTATAALFDLLNYLFEPAQTALRQGLFERLSLQLIPMLNPDGAERACRENAQGIDINRDALALQTPEGRILMAATREFKPQFAFNLHDQNRSHAVGASRKPATISMLAPPFDHANSGSDSRSAAMQLIGELNGFLQGEIPGQVGRYDDSWSPRAFGDTFSGLGIATLLIESGAHAADDHRQVARRLNAQALQRALSSIAEQRWQHTPLSVYASIPFNRDQGIKDLLLRRVQVRRAEQSWRTDIAINFRPEGGTAPIVEDLGDLSVYGAWHEWDGSSHELVLDRDMLPCKGMPADFRLRNLVSGEIDHALEGGQLRDLIHARALHPLGT